MEGAAQIRRLVRVRGEGTPSSAGAGSGFGAIDEYENASSRAKPPRRASTREASSTTGTKNSRGSGAGSTPSSARGSGGCTRMRSKRAGAVPP